MSLLLKKERHNIVKLLKFLLMPKFMDLVNESNKVKKFRQLKDLNTDESLNKDLESTAAKPMGGINYFPI